ncbi:hypothetical protein RJT34_19920 [Clitoria ternatea]|uniref:Ankyrin repeat protein n=1 Tax=Clitoria ternatea TaxID=43366 RepID=A0AAN9IRX7_CLITE
MKDISKYAHSLAHVAVARCDHAALRHLVSMIPCLAKAGEGETPLHLMVRLRDAISANILMATGADCPLQKPGFAAFALIT